MSAAAPTAAVEAAADESAELPTAVERQSPALFEDDDDDAADDEGKPAELDSNVDYDEEFIAPEADEKPPEYDSDEPEADDEMMGPEEGGKKK